MVIGLDERHAGSANTTRPAWNLSSQFMAAASQPPGPVGYATLRKHVKATNQSSTTADPFTNHHESSGPLNVHLGTHYTAL